MTARQTCGACYASIFPSPVGELRAVVDDDGAVLELRFAHQPPLHDVVWDDGRCAHVRRELDEYFAGERKEFGLTLRPRGTAWQQRCWDAVCRIPYGGSLDYRALATLAGNPLAFRAAGRANATNPIPIVIPCHRVIGSDGTLTGYGGGLDAKALLLLLEGGRRSDDGRIHPARPLRLDALASPPRIEDAGAEPTQVK